MLKGLIVSLVVVGALFVFTYLPQVAALAIVSGPLGAYNFPPLKDVTDTISIRCCSPTRFERGLCYYYVLDQVVHLRPNDYKFV